MPHLDSEQLALLAMGEPIASNEDSRHLAECAQCAGELRELSHAAEVGRATIDIGELETPSPVVWDRISQQLGLSAPDALAADAPAADAPAPDAPAEVAPGQQAPVVTAAPAARRRRGPARLLWVLAASIVLIAAAGLGGWAIGQLSAITPIAEAALAPFPDHPNAEGSAIVEQQRNGEQVMHVSLKASDAPDTYREVWLITADASSLISLGVLVDNEGTYTIPPGVDLRDYVLVDVSQEPIDGDPAHSGDSIVRGELSFDPISASGPASLSDPQ